MMLGVNCQVGRSTMQQLMKIVESWLKDTHYRVFSDVFRTFVQLSRSFRVVFGQFSGEKLFCYLKITRSVIIYIDILHSHYVERL